MAAAYATVGTIGQLPDGTRTERIAVGDTFYLPDIPEFSFVLPEGAFASLPAPRTGSIWRRGGAAVPALGEGNLTPGGQEMIF